MTAQARAMYKPHNAENALGVLQRSQATYRNAGMLTGEQKRESAVIEDEEEETTDPDMITVEVEAGLLDVDDFTPPPPPEPVKPTPPKPQAKKPKPKVRKKKK